MLRLVEQRCQNTNIRTELALWQSGTNSPVLPCEFEVPEGHRDFLGLLYQTLLATGVKSDAGSYYTPHPIARSMIHGHITSSSKFLDPCCGTGLFLLEAAHSGARPEAVWGFDLDELAVRIARINLILSHPDYDFTPNVFVRSGLIAPEPQFDVIATNPPWGAHQLPGELLMAQSTYGTKSKESFVHFIYACTRWLKRGGFMSMLLPNSMLNIRTHAEARKYVVQHTSIQKIEDLGRVFTGVFTPVVRIDTSMEQPTHDHEFVSHSAQGIQRIRQADVCKTPNFIFDISCASIDRLIIEEAYGHDHLTLSGNADWALGIVTGNNSLYLQDNHTDGTEPIYRGKDLRRFVPGPAAKFISFQPFSFQQVAPESKYRVPEKLIYRFVSRELVFAYDSNQSLSLNSANVLIPRLPGYSIKSVLAILNSNVHQFIYQRRFNALKVLRGDLELLPFPLISTSLENSLCDCVDTIIANSREQQEGLQMRTTQSIRSRLKRLAYPVCTEG